MTVFIGNTPTIRITVKDSTGTALDISSASAKQIIVKPPGGSASTNNASFTTTGTDGKMQIDYSDTTILGTYEVQGKVTISSKTYHTEIDTFEVEQPLA